MFAVQNKEKFITLEEAAKYLKISAKAVNDLVDKGRIPAYHLPGKHLRFKKSQLQPGSFQDKILPREEAEAGAKPTFPERVRDFIYFYDFYIISLIFIILILFIIFRF